MIAPAVSIGLPVFNGEPHVEQAIDSILSQSLDNLELVICDNASTDRTEEICRAYANHDQRVRYYRNDENVGYARNFNLAFGYSRSKYFKWAAADDFIEPEFLERCISILDSDPGVVLATSRVQLVDTQGSPYDFDEAFQAWVLAAGGKYRPTKKADRLNSNRPTERFADVVLRKQYYHEMYGVIRANELRRTSLHGLFIGSDKVLVAELALLGRFGSVDEELFKSRIYLDRPTKYRSRNLARTVDPHWAEPRFYLPEARLAKEYLRVALTCPGGSLKRMSCLWTVARKVLQPDKLAKLFIPGRGNYLGLGKGRSEAP